MRSGRRPRPAGLALAATALLAGVSCTRSKEGALPHPNVILISVDTLRADRLNLHGYRRHTTSPIIDALARDGIVHDAHVASAPWTTPSHVSLLTSLHPSAHGVTRGFESVLRGDAEPARWVRLGADHATLAEVLLQAGYRTAAFTGGATLDPSIGFGRGFETYTTSMYKISPRRVQPMLDWLAADRSRPSFLFWHTFEVHAPYNHGEFLPDSRSGLRTDLARATAMLQGDSATSQHTAFTAVVNELLTRHGARILETSSTLYDGGVASMDRWIGRLVGFLLDHDLYDSTMIVLTSDHGDEFADHDPEMFYDAHGHSVYQELLHVPLIVKLPGSAHAGTRVSAVTSGVDVMPTVLEVAGVEGPIDQMQGRSLVGLWAGRTEPDRMAFAEATAYAGEMKSVRGPRYKLILQMDPATVAEHGRSFVPDVPARRLLFDLRDDPGERSDLLGSAEGAEEIAAGLESRLRAFVSASPGEVEEIELGDEAVERLKALGYLQ